MNRCSKENCIGWKNCVGLEHYSYGEIRFCPFQCIWIIEHACILSHGEWPQHPDGDVDTKTQLASEGRFTLACETIAEVRDRLKNVDTRRRELLIQEIRAEKQFSKNSIERMSDEAISVLLYISGWPRKRDTYYDWNRKREDRQRRKALDIHM